MKNKSPQSPNLSSGIVKLGKTGLRGENIKMQEIITDMSALIQKEQERNLFLKKQIWDEELEEIDSLFGDIYGPISDFHFWDENPIIHHGPLTETYLKHMMIIKRESHTNLAPDALKLFFAIPEHYQYFSLYVPIKTVVWCDSIISMPDGTFCHTISDPYGTIMCEPSVMNLSDHMGCLFSVNLFLINDPSHAKPRYKIGSYKPLPKK